MSFAAAFLSHPAGFPAAAGGEPWGDEGLELEVAGFRLAVSGLTGGQRAAIAARAAALGLLPAAGVVAAAPTPVRVYRSAVEDYHPIDTRGWEYSFDLAAEPAALRLAGLRMSARVDWRPEPEASLWLPAGDGEAIVGPFENLARVLVAHRLSAEGGLLLHSSGVATSRGLLLAFGPSGAGKSTFARLALAAGLRVASDDLHAVLPGDPPSARPVPFGGDLGPAPPSLAGPSPVAALVRLRRGVADRLVSLRPATAVASLLAVAPYLNADPYRRPRLEVSLEELTRRVPAFELTFSLAGRCWAALARARLFG